MPETNSFETALPWLPRRSLLSFNPDDRPSADRVLASSLLAKKAGSPSQQQPQGSTASAQSAQTADGRLGGLVLQRSVHC